MTRGSSGRIVIEIDPEQKARIYSELALRQKSLKAWFLECVEKLLADDGQLDLLQNDGDGST